MDLITLQAEIGKWADKNFGEHTPSYHPLLGVGEEVGELNHAHLKGEQQIRAGSDPQEIFLKKSDAIGDIVIFLMHYCYIERLTLENCIRDAWNEVKDRDWTKDRPAPFAEKFYTVTKVDLLKLADEIRGE